MYILSDNIAKLQTDAAHLLTFTFIILLRCTVESSDEAITLSCKASIVQFWAKLHDAAENEGWDLAGMCISRCTESMSKIMNHLNLRSSDPVLPIEIIQQGDVLHQATEHGGGMYDSEATGLEGLSPAIVPFSNLDLWFENPPDASWSGLDIGSQIPFFNQEFNMGHMNI